MEKDVLLPTGSLVEVTRYEDEIITYMIIGQRVINHVSLKSWDYIAVPFPTGAVREIKKDMTNCENFFYFNHYEIEKIIFVFSSPLDTENVTNEEE